MKRDSLVLRDEAAEPTMRRIEADRQRVCEALKPALAVIARRLFDHDFNVNALWRETGLRKESSPLFASQLGATPGDYIGTRRFEVAEKLLADTDLKLHQIGSALGYSVASDSFPRAFRHRYRMSATAYRKVARGGVAGGPPRASRSAAATLAERVGRAAAAGDLEGAVHMVSEAEAAVRDQAVRRLAADLGLACHERGAQRTRAGDVDRAYDDLALARLCYGAAGDLPPAIQRGRRHVAVSEVTDDALLSALCSDCRTSLAGAEGRTVRHELRLALRFIPRDLEWFGVCCDDCYRAVWNAISRARAGLMDDAWKAWWLSVNADLEVRETPPSRGRIIAALTEVERLVSGDQLERKGYSELAVADAMALGDPLLEVQARIWRGCVLRATGELADARTELRNTAEASRTTPWLAALHDRMAGILEKHRNHWQKGVDLLRSAAALYKDLDPHISGLLLIEQAIAHFYLAEYPESVACNQDALSLLDGRRDPLPGNGIVPVNLACYYALIGDRQGANSAISRCHFDRKAHPCLAAKEIFTRACLELLYGRVGESVRLFGEARQRFERLHRPLDVALTASYAVEAHARLGNCSGAVANAAAALRYFQAAGCTQNTLEAAGKLRAILEAEEVDVIAVTAAARSLGRGHGGWLPEPE